MKGSIDNLATSLAIANNFSKQNHKFPTYDELFDNTILQDENNKKKTYMTRREKDEQVLNEFNAWARY